MRLILLLALLFAPSVVTAQERHAALTHAVIAANAFAAVADVSSTAWAMGVNDGCDCARYREANPLARWATQDPTVMAAYKVAIGGAQLWLLHRIHQRKPKTAIVAGIGLALANGYIAHRNAAQIRRR